MFFSVTVLNGSCQVSRLGGLSADQMIKTENIFTLTADIIEPYTVIFSRPSDNQTCYVLNQRTCIKESYRLNAEF